MTTKKYATLDRDEAMRKCIDILEGMLALDAEAVVQHLSLRYERPKVPWGRDANAARRP